MDIFPNDASLRRRRWLTVLISAVFCPACLLASAQEKPSFPIPNSSVIAGNPAFVSIDLEDAPPIQVSVIVEFRKRPIDQNPSSLSRTQEFTCQGNIPAGQKYGLAICGTARTLQGGVYEATRMIENALGLPEGEKADAVIVNGPKLHLITVIENPPDPPKVIRLPGIAAASVVFPEDTAFSDAAIRTKTLLEDFNTKFPRGLSNSPRNRAYLLDKIDEEKRTILLTQRRWLAGPPARTEAPVLFTDFTRRLDAITRHLGAKPLEHNVVQNDLNDAHFVLVQEQRPQASDSITAVPASDVLDKDADAFVRVLTDGEIAFERISTNGQKKFNLSVTTDPPLADVYYIQFGEHVEKKWSDKSNFHDEPIDYATYVFRIDWQGCSKFPDVSDVWVEGKLKIDEEKKGCNPQ